MEEVLECPEDILKDVQLGPVRIFLAEVWSV